MVGDRVDDVGGFLVRYGLSDTDSIAESSAKDDVIPAHRGNKPSRGSRASVSQLLLLDNCWICEGKANSLISGILDMCKPRLGPTTHSGNRIAISLGEVCRLQDARVA